MIMRQQNQIDPWQIVQADGGIGPADGRHPGRQMDGLSGVEEVGLWNPYD